MKYRWKLRDLESVPKNGYRVFSCFSCGGGSSMGYKLAGYDVIGNVELDPCMADIYKTNLKPKYPYQIDIREFNKKSSAELPAELFDIDILDGSPPCSTFSMAGRRAEKWGKEYRFREGQKKQRLDMLFFDFIDTVEKLKPKIVVAENVIGLMRGDAKGYMNEILQRFDKANYSVQIFRLNAASMGVPQTRERLFFIAKRKNIQLEALVLLFDEPRIPFKEYMDSNPQIPIKKSTTCYTLWKSRKFGDDGLDCAHKRLGGKGSFFSHRLLYEDRVVSTITANGTPFIRFSSPHHISDREILLSQSFPEDYDFKSQNVQYVCGMSVPPVMMGKIAEQIKIQWLDKLK